MTSKIYIFDTNIILNNPNSIYDFKNSSIVIPFVVLEELDTFKTRLDVIGFNARTFIKTIDELRSKGNLFKGVKIYKGKGLLYVRDIDIEIKSKLNLNIPDNKIIAIAQIEKFNNPDKKIIVVSNDVNVRVKCDALEIESQNHIDNQTINKRENLYTGFDSHLVDDQIIDRFYAGESIILSKEEIKVKLFANQTILLISNSNEKKTALAKFINYLTPLKKIIEYKNGVFDIRAKNKEQLIALNLLMDPSIPIVSLNGIAGSGKSLLCLAAGLEQTLGKNPLSHDEPKYKRLIVIRPLVPVGRDVGYLPGDLQEKLSPWLQPITDNLRFLFGNDKMVLDEYVEKGIIEVDCMTFMRGRSISDAFIILDEVQNLSPHEIKTALTRVGENTKIVMTGDTQQIDSITMNEYTNGLTSTIEKLKGESIFGHITLTKGERSLVATICSKLL